MSESGTDLTPEERAALDALPRQSEPPESLRRRIKEDLRRAGHLSSPERRRSNSPWRRLRAAAALLLVFLAGYAAGSDGWSGWPGEDDTPVAGAAAGSGVPGTPPRGELLQRLGTEYAEAIADLENDYRSGDPELEAARAAALATFLGASERVAGLFDRRSEILEALPILRAAVLRDEDATRIGWF